MSNLETAQAADAAPRRDRAGDPCRRPRKVTILLDQDDHVHPVRLHTSSFRLRGVHRGATNTKAGDGAAALRHRRSPPLAAAKAMDVVAGYGPLAQRPRSCAGSPLRQMSIERCTSSISPRPIELLAVESEVAKRNIVGRGRRIPRSRQAGILTRKFRAGSDPPHRRKRIHGTGCIPGGMNKALTAAERDLLRIDVDQIVAWSREAIDCAAPA